MSEQPPSRGDGYQMGFGRSRGWGVGRPRRAEEKEEDARRILCWAWALIQHRHVVLWLTDPPSPSHLCFHLSGLEVTDLMDEPLVVCLGEDIAVIRVVYNVGFRPAEYAHEIGVPDLDYLVYRAHHTDEPPSLDVLPKPNPHAFHPSEIGFFLCGDGGEEFYYMAVLRSRFVHLQYDLHVFSSRTNAWTTRPALLELPWPGYKEDYLVHVNDRVMALEGGLLGWVDLWRGILLCSVLDADPVVRCIRFPKPMVGNMRLYRHYLQDSVLGFGPTARAIRDVTFNDGFIKLIEMEDRRRLDAIARTAMLDSGLEVENSMGAGTTECYTPDGWTTVTWSRKLSSDRWRQECTAYVSTSTILPQLTQNQSEILALENLEMAGPLWSTHDEDVVYLMAKEDSKDKYALAIGFNTRKSTVDGVTLFPEERNGCFQPSIPALCTIQISQHGFSDSPELNTICLAMTSLFVNTDGNLQSSTFIVAAPICWIEEREDSKNDPDNTMLKGIFAMYGELCYLKILADEKYGLVKFVNRSCAEQAISALMELRLVGRVSSFHGGLAI